MLIETLEGYDFSLADFNVWAKEIGFTQTSIIPLIGPSSAIVAIKEYFPFYLNVSKTSS